jgi:hypothetical protein
MSRYISFQNVSSTGTQRCPLDHMLNSVMQKVLRNIGISSRRILIRINFKFHDFGRNSLSCTTDDFHIVEFKSGVMDN